ncbi:MAG: chemotaxis protein CheW, partial [Anaerolineales bacterium]|nr:chemotaxis protein CheW [Anaerolineales bacterium]
ANDRNKKGRKSSAAERMKGALHNALNGKDESETPPASAPVESETKKNDAPPVLERRSPASDSEVLRTRVDDGETVRVKVGRLDTLMDHLNELLIVKIRTQQRLEQITSVKTGIANLEKEWQFVRSAYAHRVHTQSADTDLAKTSKDEKKILDYTMVSQEQVHNSNHELNIVARELASDISQMTLAIDELEQEVKSLRMLPLSTITAAFPRMVRDLANEHNKEIIFQVKGADTELDKHVMEQIKDPLVHLLRNAIDHGIESPSQRLAAGKIRAGQITLSAEQVGKDIVIKVSDDGMGLDLNALRKSVARLGVDTSQLGEAELQQYIFEPGVTTNKDVTNTSGRGMGLDIVQTNMEELHGTCEVASTPETGTTFTLIIPLRLTGSRGLMVKSSGQLFALPINTVEYIRSIRKDNVALLEGHDVIYHNEQPIPLLWLCDVLDLPRVISFNGNTELSVIILKNSDRRIAFIVDELAGEQEIVVKGLGDQLIRIAGLAGATILGTGEVVLILNPKDLMGMAIKGGYTSAMKLPATDNKTPLRENRPMRRILVVDDSITTRTLEKNILEAAGYNVELATDGQEALNMVSAGSQPDLIISDVAMPRVDGLELTRRMKSNSQTAQIPIIL